VSERQLRSLVSLSPHQRTGWTQALAANLLTTVNKPRAWYALAMSEDAESDVPTPEPLTYDAAKFSQLFDNLRSSMRRYVDSLSTAFDKASDLNKQQAAFHERLLLIDLGTIGLSVTALTSVASKVAMVGFRKYLVIVLVGLAWSLLLRSTFLCSAIMLGFLAANRKLYEEWGLTVSQSNGEHITMDFQRLSLGLKGTIQMEDKAVDIATLFNNAATEIRSAFTEAKRAHIEKTLKTGGATEGLSTGQKSQLAIRYMQMALMLLALAAMILVIAL
jgi:hypothetical protein